MCFKKKQAVKQTIGEIIARDSAGMSDKEKSEYASEIDQTVFDELLKVPFTLVEITPEQWNAAARAQYPAMKIIELPDAVLYTITEGELKSVLSRDWTNLCKYVTDLFDCDKFADLLVAHLEKYYKVTAVREVWGNTTQGYHAFCLAVLKQGDGFIARLVEPQTDDIFVTAGPLGIYSPEKTK
jgi:hypothetical protein